MRFDDGVAALSAVNAADDAFRITTAEDISGLKRSIQGVGLIAPPLLHLSSAGSGVRIIAGFRRVAACRALGWDRIPARVMPPDTPEWTCARLAVADNAFQRPLNLIEISRALSLLSTHCQDPAALCSAAGDLELPDTPDLIRKLLPLCTLPEPLQSGILSGVLSLSMARTLSSLDAEPAARLTDLFSELRLSLNKQREILTLLEEIAAREDRTIVDILREDAPQSILKDADADRNQRAAALRRCLRRRRYPAISRAEAAFTDNLRDLPLGGGVQLIPPPHFESPVYTLSITFKSPSELTHRRRRVGEILSHPALEKILS